MKPFPSGHPPPLLVPALMATSLVASLVASSAAAAAATPAWKDIDDLRGLLERNGARVVQRDCGQRGLQGLYHEPSGTIVVCRVHRDPVAVWNTLAHEATHRMQACAGRDLTDPGSHAAMAQALARHAPEELRSLRVYPRQQQVAELEARYTSRLRPDQVIALFRRYCGAGAPSSLTLR